MLNLARLEAEHADPLAALDHITLALRNYHDSGNTSTMRTPLAILATLFDRLRRRLSQAERPMHSTSGHAAVRLEPFWSELGLHRVHIRHDRMRLVHKSAPNADQTRRSQPYATTRPTIVIKVRPNRVWAVGLRLASSCESRDLFS